MVWSLCPIPLFTRSRSLRRRFADVDEVKTKTEELSDITEDAFKKGFEQLNKRIDKCINFIEEYFERNWRCSFKKLNKSLCTKIVSSVSFRYALVYLPIFLFKMVLISYEYILQHSLLFIINKNKIDWVEIKHSYWI